MQINYYSFGLNERFDLITCLNLDCPLSVFCHSCSSLWKTSLCYQQENRSRKWCEVKEFYQCLPERNRTFFFKQLEKMIKYTWKVETWKETTSTENGKKIWTHLHLHWNQGFLQKDVLQSQILGENTPWQATTLSVWQEIE